MVGLVARLPDGARYALWTSGDRPTKVVDHTDDRQAAGHALRMVAPRAATTCSTRWGRPRPISEKLAREGDRTAVVLVTFTGPEFSYRDKYRSAEEGEKNAELFLAAQVDAGGDDFETRSNLSYVLDRVARATGGRYDVVLSAMGTDDALRKLSAAPALRLPPQLRDRRRPQEAEARRERRPPGTKVLLPAGSERETSAGER